MMHTLWEAVSSYLDVGVVGATAVIFFILFMLKDKALSKANKAHFKEINALQEKRIEASERYSKLMEKVKNVLSVLANENSADFDTLKTHHYDLNDKVNQSHAKLNSKLDLLLGLKKESKSDESTTPKEKE